MAKGEYRGVDGVARKVVKEYRGVDGVARKVTKAYRGVGGIARKYFGVDRPERIQPFFEKGTYWPDTNTYAYTETETSLKAELFGEPTQSGNVRTSLGYAITGLSAGDSVTVTFSANKGSSFSDNAIGSAMNSKWYNTDAVSNQTVTFGVVASDNGAVWIACQNGATGLTYRYVEITRVVVNGVQIFPIM